MYPAVDKTQKRGLWSPQLGIRFSAKRTKTLPSYPVLDPSRLQQICTSSADCAAVSAEKNEEDVKGDFEDAAEHLTRGDAAVEASIEAVCSEALEIAIGMSQGECPLEDDLIDPELADDDLLSALDELPKPDTRKSAKDIDPPWSSLSFNISPELFQRARRSAANSPDSFWCHTMYQKLEKDSTVEKVKVHYCASKHSMEHVCQKYFLGEDVLGFDLEWLAFANRKSGPRENVSLIQIASASRIALFHVAMFPKDDFVGPIFRRIMKDASVSKVGVHIQADCTRLKNYLGVETRGIFELSHLYKVVKHSSEKRPGLINKIPVALSTQVQDQLRLPMYKGQSVRSSNWMKPLSAAQIKYSASDAYAGLQLYYILEEKRKRLDPCPPQPHHAELGLPIPVLDSESSDISDEDAADLAAEVDTVKAQAAKADKGVKTARQPREKAAITRDPRIVTADLKMKEYRSSKTTQISATPAALRTYYVWHSHADLKPADIASLLRDPPLQTNTVLTYILEAISAEALPYDKPRLKGEVLALLNDKLASRTRYKVLIQDCQHA